MKSKLIFALAFLLPLACAASAADHGHFVGRIVTVWLDDGRRMELLEPFAFVDPEGVEWSAPKGSIVDGASIPQAAWSIIGGPFEGKYRKASVIHDVACVEKKRPWQKVHRAFYEAMLADGVSVSTAKTMFMAVYYEGPRWDRIETAAAMSPTDVTRIKEELSRKALNGEMVTATSAQAVSCSMCAATGHLEYRVSATYKPFPPRITSAQFEELRQKIETKDLSLDEIETYYH